MTTTTPRPAAPDPVRPWLCNPELLGRRLLLADDPTTQRLGRLVIDNLVRPVEQEAKP